MRDMMRSDSQSLDPSTTELSIRFRTKSTLNCWYYFEVSTRFQSDSFWNAGFQVSQDSKTANPSILDPPNSVGVSTRHYHGWASRTKGNFRHSHDRLIRKVMPRVRFS